MRVLVVEDFDLLRDSLVKGLSEAGFATDAAADGEEGLWMAQSNDYDVIVLDLMLPQLDGLTVLQRLREKNRGTSVLILTAKDGTDDRVKGLDTGADDYLVKPFAFAELLARVRALVRRRYDVKSPTIKIGPWTSRMNRLVWADWVRRRLLFACKTDLPSDQRASTAPRPSRGVARWRLKK